MNITIAAPRGSKRRISSEAAWPLRDAQGRTWAQRKVEEAQKCTDSASQ